MQAERIERAVSWLRTQSDAIEQDLEALVTLSSYTEDIEGVRAAGEHYASICPLPAKQIPGTRYAPHFRFDSPGGAANAGGVVLVGHLDTVYPRKVFSGFTRQGRMARGPGTLDMKGGLIVIAYALRALEHVRALEEIPLSVVAVSDEEVGSPEGAFVLVDAATGAKAALVFEAGRDGDRIIVARKGTRSVRAHAHGKAAHAGNNYTDGANAIWALARFIDRAQRMTDLESGITVNVGQVRGGVARNSVPADAEAAFDLRYEKLVQELELREKIEQAARVELPEGTWIELQWESGRLPLEATPASLRLAEVYGRCAADAGLGNTLSPRVGGGSDASTTAAVGVPSIDGLGPRGRAFHTPDECVELDSLIPKAEALVRYLSLHAHTVKSTTTPSIPPPPP